MNICISLLFEIGRPGLVGPQGIRGRTGMRGLKGALGHPGLQGYKGFQGTILNMFIYLFTQSFFLKKKIFMYL